MKTNTLYSPYKHSKVPSHEQQHQIIVDMAKKKFVDMNE
jgi:hypothetical protein